MNGLMKRWTVLVAVVLAPAAGGQHYESLQLEPFEGSNSSWLGAAVAISSPWALVGDFAAGQGGSGEAYFYLREPTGWCLVQATRQGGPGARFAQALAIDGTTAVMGAQTWDFFGTRTGKAYVYELIDEQWQMVQELHPKGLPFKAGFGYAVAISGDVLVVGARGVEVHPGIHGEVFIYERGASGWDLVTSFRQERNERAKSWGGLGASVAVWRNRIVVGSAGPHGLARIYERDGQGWHEVAIVRNPDPTPKGFFGGSVAVWGDTVVVGDPEDESDFGHSDGSVFVYQRTPGGKWPQVQELTASDGFGGGDFGDGFGRDVYVHMDRMVVGADYAKQDGEKLRGKVYVFERQPSQLWIETDHLVSTSSEKEGLGYSVAISGGFVVVGAPYAGPSEGAAYMFEIELGQRFCEAVPNSTGVPARMTVTGQPDVAREDLLLSVRDVPPGAAGSFLMAAQRGPKVALGDGWLCLGAGSRRVTPLATVGADGAAIHAIDLGNPVLAGLLLPGSTWHFQFLFRDLAGGPAGFNASDAIAVALE